MSIVISYMDVTLACVNVEWFVLSLAVADFNCFYCLESNFVWQLSWQLTWFYYTLYIFANTATASLDNS